MSVIYSHRGFPVQVAAEPGSVYESPIVTEIWKNHKLSEKPGFSEEMVDIAILANEWNIDGGMFNAALDPAARLSGIVQSFIAETALMLTGGISRRRVGFNDWTMMLTPATDGSATVQRFEPHELDAVQSLCKLSTAALFKRWVSTLGLADLVYSMQLFVGERDRFSR